MAEITLRPYQLDALEALWSELFHSRTALCVASTGSGKTEIIIALIKRAIEFKPKFRAIVLVNRVDLLIQTHTRFSSVFGHVDVGIYCGSSKKYQTNQNITIASIQSIHNVDLSNIDLIILDECHNVDQESGRYFDFLTKHISSKVIAFTATPYRSTGYIYGKGKLFSKITYKRGLLQLINDGYLVRPVIKKVNEQFDTSKLHVRMGEFCSDEIEELTGDEGKVKKQIDDAILRMADRKKVVWACSSIKHCEMVNRLLTDANEKSVTLHSKMDEYDRLRAKNSFERQDTRHIVFVSVISEGYDYPPIDCVVLMRPIRSPVLYVQIVGRGLRLYQDKKDLLVLDYGQVVETLGPLDDPMVSRGGVRGKKQKPTGMKFCPKCLSYIESKKTQCLDCGYIWPEKTAIKTLNEKSYEGGILSYDKTPVRVEIRGVRLEKFKSKNGNDCLKISYTPSFPLAQIINEFFVWGNEWAHRRMIKRLVDLDIKLESTLDEQVKQCVNRMPKAIVVIDGKYKTIQSIDF